MRCVENYQEIETPEEEKERQTKYFEHQREKQEKEEYLAEIYRDRDECERKERN